jgi:hypothetical protein
MAKTSKINKKTKVSTLSKKVKISKGVDIDSNRLEEFKKELIDQSNKATNTTVDEEFERELDVEVPTKKQKNLSTQELIDEKLDDKIKLDNEVSYSGFADTNLTNIVKSQPFNSGFYIVEFAELDIESLNSKLQELQKPETVTEDKELQIEAIQKLIKENIDVSKKVNGRE